MVYEFIFILNNINGLYKPKKISETNPKLIFFINIWMRFKSLTPKTRICIERTELELISERPLLLHTKDD